ncbi:MAG TPA: transporter substrate-binding domain-containing protein [Oscillospiraceae bacterium]|nr:transporter substrate-binding domain-containing protein [Oscillospiraceae bacterium]HQQ89442.1 transporter substrate-binding domain-containing protein [Oscillospiraceae bacterium]HRW56710.1 transporter substrate-binding domain-containing protein [Oscillospiraceae bacterium]
MKKLFAMILAVLMVVSLAACGTTEEESSAPEAETSEEAVTSEGSEAEQESEAEYGPVLAKIKEAGKLVVGTEAQYAPFEFKDLDANYAGCDMWLAQQIADSLGVELEIVDMAFDGIIPAVQAGQVDMGIAAFTKTDERAEVIDFTNLYQQDEQLLIVKAGNEDVYTTVESLAGLQVGAQKGTVQSQLIQSALPDSILFELDKYPSLALEVANGNIAGLVVDGAVGEALVASNDQLAVANFAFDPAVAQFGKAIVIQKGNEDLVAATNEVIDKVIADGSFATAYEEAKTLAQELGL